MTDVLTDAGTRRRSGRVFVLAMLLPMFVLLAAFTLYPFVSVLVYSLREMDLTSPSRDGFAGLSNFVGAMSASGLLNSVVITIVLVVTVVIVEFITGFFVATMLWRPLPGSRIYLSLLVLPFAATPVAAYLAWRLMLNPDGGQVNTLLSAVGLPEQAWTSDPTLALVSIMAVDIWQWSPFVTLIMVAGLQSLPSEPFEAAALDGAGAWQRVRLVALPLLKPLIAFVVTFRAIDAARTFDSIWIITQGGPGSATETLTVRIYREAFTNLDIGQASALGLLLLIGLIVLGRTFAAPTLQRLEK
ncbi:MAG: carbohydrate ABC transporter permease [Beutenbergiaceae bacterium]